MKRKTIKALSLDQPRRNPPPNPANIAQKLRRIKTEIDLMSVQIGDFLGRIEAQQDEQHHA